MSRQEVRVTARVPASLKDLMRKYVERDTHLNESDFIRDAIREKIQKDAPDLIQDLFQKDRESEGP
jgi:Arc/MetJ-type ribon-helix-helix transcriptional regulator